MNRDDSAMTETKPFAALTGGLLARKGAARPAMRPHVSLDWAGIEEPASLDEMAPDLDTAWTDMGALEVVEEEETRPEVLRQISQLSTMINRKVATTRQAALDVEQLPGKKVAFTLRLDPRRHGLLRACCTAEKRSAQALLVEALDRLVDATPGLEAVVEALPQTLPQTNLSALTRRAR